MRCSERNKTSVDRSKKSGLDTPMLVNEIHKKGAREKKLKEKVGRQ